MNVCRICLCSKPRKDVTQLKPTDNDEKQNHEDIMLFCLGVQIAQDSKMSTKLCVKCFKKIVEFYKFKCLALKNDAYLRSADSQNVKNEVFLTDDIKQEDISEPGDDESNVEPLVEPSLDVKAECKEEDKSDDELLSVIKKIKIRQLVEETKENEPIKKKKGCPRIPKKVCKGEPKKVCDECGKVVKNLKQHLLKHMPKDLQKHYKCELCEKIFATYNGKHKHVKRKHFGIKQQCNMCDKSVTNLKQHILTIHKTESLPYACVPCGRRFISKTRLDMHLTVHTKDRPHECDICGKKFRIKFSMLLHKRQVHDKEKSHLCQFCSKSFFKKHHLQIHLRSHTKERPYECPDCGKHFSSSTTVKNHRLTHSTEKKFNCTLCDMSFTTPSYLRVHMISHTKEKRYPCQYCGVKFHRSDHRKRHEFTAHLRHSSIAAAT